MAVLNKKTEYAISFMILAILLDSVSAQSGFMNLLEDHVGLILLIASFVIIALQILMLIFLQSINDHLNWIRRIR